MVKMTFRGKYCENGVKSYQIYREVPSSTSNILIQHAAVLVLFSMDGTCINQTVLTSVKVDDDLR